VDDLAVAGQAAIPGPRERAAVRADHPVGAVRLHRADTDRDGEVDADEVEDHRRALAVRDTLQLGRGRAIDADDRMVRAEFGDVVQPVGIVVDRDDRRRAERTKQLHRERTQPAGADDHGGRTGCQLVKHLTHAVIRRGAGIRERGGDARIEGSDRHDIAGSTRDHELGQASIAAVAPTGEPMRAGAVESAHA